MTESDSYREWAPPPEWQHAVACCWEHHVSTDRVHRVVPDGHADLLIYSSGRVEVVGLHDQLDLPALSGGTRIRGIRLRPEAVAPAFHTSGASLRNMTVPGDDVFGRRQASQLRDDRGLDRWLRDVEPDARTAAAVRLLADHTVEAVASELDVSERHLRRILVNDIGLAPKPYQRIRRLQRFLAASEHGLDIAAAAAESGYADQSHLTREARSLTEHTPLRLLELRGITGTAR